MATNYQSSPRTQYPKRKVYDEEQKSSQRVIIPRGTVDPNQTTIIEIPSGMENMPTIVAQKSQVNRPLSPSRRQYLPNPQQERPPQYSKSGQPERSQPSQPFNHSMPEKSNNKRFDEGVDQDKLPPKQGRTNQKYLREAGGLPLGENYYDVDPKYYMKNYPKESARREDPGYYNDRNVRERSPAYASDQRRSRSAKQYLQIPNEYRTKMNYQPQPPATSSPTVEINKSLRIKRVLDRLDEIELQGLEEDLKNFQTARRKLIFDVSSMKMF